jgi:hypothetical protein
MGKKLGKLERVDPRTIWKHEAHDFTPWLVENIEHAGRSARSSISKWSPNARQTSATSPSTSWPATSGATGSSSSRTSSNQPTTSHLGQLITYAAGLDASVVIWVSREFREEHRQALDWLNRGHERRDRVLRRRAIEVVRIDGSIAGRQAAASSPRRTTWSRQTVRAGLASDAVSPASGLAYQAFFQLLIDELREKHKFTNAKAGTAAELVLVRLRHARLHLRHELRAVRRAPRRGLHRPAANATTNQTAFARTARRPTKARIEKPSSASRSAGSRLEGRRSCRVACYAPGSIEDAPEQLEQHRRWAVAHLLKLKQVFGPRLPTLQPTET